ncbi:MAG: hypothetical protein Q8R10_14325 [Pseudomonas sp.]|uniref:hypothetical protein n=1 Tax=Pseudomonas sp. TaxID=306 RepID=UPI002733458A|nr:hypothetical protein [Pseudomonas sp.]MDP3847591.1 hypothetical protein [Pseudomonas sp.]
MPSVFQLSRGLAFARLHWPMLACAMLVGAVVLFVRIGLSFEFPIPWNDETAFIAQAFEFSRSGSFFVYGLNSERVVMWMPPGYMLLLAGVYKVCGYSFEISRWVSTLLYLGSFGVGLAIIRATLTGWRQMLALVLMLVAFLSPYSLAIANIARMEGLYTLIFLFSLLAALRGKYALGLALVLLGATVHYNAVYFLLPYGVLVLWKILRRETLSIGPGELLALVIAALALAGYGLFVIKHIDGFWQDMRFQFAYKLGAPVMGGREGWTLLGLVLLIPCLQLMVHRRLGAEALLSLYGVAFIAMTLNGHNMWYYFAYNFGFWLLLLGVLASSAAVARPMARGACLVIALLLLYQLGLYVNRSTAEFDPLKPCLSMLSRDFLPASEIDKVRVFIATLPPNTSVSFGYSGVEPYFFADFARSGARWTGSAHSVTQVFPARSVDYRVLCDSTMFPAYLSVYDWDGYPRKSQDSGCAMTRLRKEQVHAQ